MTRQFTLGKTERLKSRKLIESLFREGACLYAGPVKLFYQWQTTQGPLQFGVGAGTRHFKKAVDRNRIKRMIREAYRLQKSQLKLHQEKTGVQLLVFFIYTGKELRFMKRY